jgi:hypothetical protein
VAIHETAHEEEKKEKKETATGSPLTSGNYLYIKVMGTGGQVWDARE